MIKIQMTPDILRIINEKTEPHLKDLKFHNYDLTWLVKAVYLQGLLDAYDSFK